MRNIGAIAAWRRPRALRARRIVLVGGFDADNFGDALFPSLATDALRRRLGRRTRIDVYGWRDLAPGHRSYGVRDVVRLPDEIAGADLLVLGGGQLVRGDPLGPTFEPASASVHDPLGIWLIPTLTALAAGTPVAWNVLGVSPTIPPGLGAVAGVVAGLVDHLAVRDAQSARWFAEQTGVAPVVLPDSVFGLARRRSDSARLAAEEFLRDAGLADERFVVLQPSDLLAPVLDHVREALGHIAADGVRILELPIGPCLGDAPGVLDVGGVQTVSAPRWPAPPVLAEVISRAEGAIGISYHLGVTAVTAGVPVLRPPSPPGWKYATLDALPGVTLLGSGAPFITGRTPVAAETRAMSDAVERHWDAVAAIAARGRSPRDAIRGRVDVLQQIVAAAYRT